MNASARSRSRPAGCTASPAGGLRGSASDTTEAPRERPHCRWRRRLRRVAGAELHVRGVVDDRIQAIGWSRLGTGPVIVPGFGWLAIGSDGVTPEWDEVVQASVDALQAKVADAARGTAEKVETDIQLGRPASALLKLSQEVDLLLIGSRRWGPVARVILGSTGEALLHDASCPVLVVPRPKG